MKVQFHGDRCFSLKGASTKVVFDPLEEFNAENFDICLSTEAEKNVELNGVKKSLNLPGEYEISEILVKGFYSRPENVVYKISMDDISFVHFGNIEHMPDSQLFEKIGENVDVAFICLSEKCNGKLAKEIISTMDPRMVILGGDSKYYPEMVENSGAKTAEENPIKISRSGLSDDKTDILILNV